MSLINKMAYFDYLHCAVCESKVLYDADIDYEESNCGDIKVLCKECIKNNTIIILPQKEKWERKGVRYAEENYTINL